MKSIRQQSMCLSRGDTCSLGFWQSLVCHTQVFLQAHKHRLPLHSLSLGIQQESKEKAGYICNWVSKVLTALLLLSRFSRVQPSATPWTSAYQAPPSMGFSRQEYWSRVPLPSPIALRGHIFHSNQNFVSSAERAMAFWRILTTTEHYYILSYLLSFPVLANFHKCES